MASQISNERGSLSIAIVSSLNALRNKSKSFWLKLKSKSNDFACSSNCIPPNKSRSRPLQVEVDSPMSVEAYYPIRVEAPVITEDDRFIARIESNRWRPTKPELCIWIICSFYENLCIPIDDLVMYGICLNMFGDVHGMIGARDRVYGLIETMNETLNDLFQMDDVIKLCDKEYDSQYVKLPDSVYNAALMISERYSSILQGNRGMRTWGKDEVYRYENCYVLSLSLSLENISEHPVYWFPKLGILRLTYGKDSQSLPVNFFAEMEELRILILNVPSLTQSLYWLRNLQTLCLEVRKLEDISWIRYLINLEFLTISTVSLIDIPMEMSELINLRFLNLGKMNLAYIPPGVFSRMLKLEELYLPLSFRSWGYRNKEYDGSDESERKMDDYDDEERFYVRLPELEHLPLSALQICIPNVLMLLRRSPFFRNIRRFKILVSNNLQHQEFGNSLMNELQLTGDAYDIREIGVLDLISLTKSLTLTRVRNLKNVMYQLGDDGFPQLKRMFITECDELKCLVDTRKPNLIGLSLFCELNSLHLSMLSNLKEIWHGARPHFRWFENLRRINIRFCHKLKYAFPLSMARGLRQLQSIEILDCNEMEGIFCKNKDDNTSGVYFVEELHLHSLPKLVGFLVQKDYANGEVIDEDAATDDEIVSNYTEEPIIASDGDFLFFPTNDDELISNKQVSCIKNKDIISDTEMYSAFSSKLMKKRLESLVKLKIAFCDELRVIFSFDENYANSAVLNSLKELELHGLRNLLHIWFRVPLEIMAFQNLRILILSECHNSYLLSPRVAELLVQLQKIEISRCEKLENIVLGEYEWEIGAYREEIVFPQLKTLELQYMPNLEIFYSGFSTIELPLLEFLKLNQCNKMKSFCPGPLNTPMLKGVETNGGLYSLMGDLNATMERYMSRENYI
ncbi:uncharacterized protein [Euphorbia lathyris]|uniref:uncharacterized protein isoform X2 n=1 Tax=Euphorbia lathyris TaxID=212925 RepID=UPI003313454F